MVLHLFTLLFVLLKLLGIITWSWLLVLAPSITAVVLAVLVLVLAVIGITWVGSR